MTHILAVSGVKQSGKTTSAQFIMASTLASLGILDAFRFLDSGEIEAAYKNDGEQVTGLVSLLSPENQEFYKGFWLEEFQKTVDQTTKVYSFADNLKQKVCIEILGLTYEQCYGTDEQKNSLTNLKWEDMPGVITDIEADYVDDRYTSSESLPFGDMRIIVHPAGAMTAREVMQFVGTKIFRKMYNNVWVDSTISRIVEDNVDLAIIADCRFPNEVEGVQAAGGKVIRLLRTPHEDNDESETALDGYEGFDLIIDNQHLTIKETNSLIERYLRDIGWFPKYLLDVKAE